MQESAVREKLLLEMKRELKKMQASGTFGAAVHGQQLTTHDLRPVPHLLVSFRLQRYRDQVRAWLILPDVKDTDLLEGTRRAIEHDMVRMCNAQLQATCISIDLVQLLACAELRYTIQRSTSSDHTASIDVAPITRAAHALGAGCCLCYDVHSSPIQVLVPEACRQPSIILC
jgi:Not1 N-terminal domain, CCR4-Not complex component